MELHMTANVRHSIFLLHHADGDGLLAAEDVLEPRPYPMPAPVSDHRCWVTQSRRKYGIVLHERGDIDAYGAEEEMHAVRVQR